jgi:hypothetical protein
MFVQLLLLACGPDFAYLSSMLGRHGNCLPVFPSLTGTMESSVLRTSGRPFSLTGGCAPPPAAGSSTFTGEARLGRRSIPERVPGEGEAGWSIAKQSKHLYRDVRDCNAIGCRLGWSLCRHASCVAAAIRPVCLLSRQHVSTNRLTCHAC